MTADHRDDPGGQGLGPSLVVRREDDRGSPGGGFAHERVEHVPGVGVKTGMGFVEQPQGRVAGDEGGERGAPPLARRTCPNPKIPEPSVEPNPSHRRVNTGDVTPAGLDGECHVFVDREVVVQKALVTKQTDGSAGGATIPPKINSEDDGRPFGHARQPGDDLEEGRFPRAVGPPNHDDLALIDPEVKPGEGGKSSVEGDDSTQRNDGFGWRRRDGVRTGQRHGVLQAGPEMFDDRGMRRLLSGVGRTLITAGVLLLLFVAYQLWGTGIRQAQLQNKLTNGFEAQLAAAGITPIEVNNPELSATGTVPPGTDPAAATDDPVVGDGSVLSDDPVVDSAASSDAGSATATTATTATTTSPPASPAVTTPPGPTLATTSTLPNVRAGRTQMKAPKPGKALGLLVIPRIKQRQIVVEGTATNDLQTGPGRYSSTAFPGQPGNVGIAGHRTTYGAPFFNLHLMRIGDPIFIQTQQGNFRYDVIDACQPKCLGRSAFVVSPNDKTVLRETPDDNILTLRTKDPNACFERLNEIARNETATIETITCTDDDLQSVFDYLVR